ncbi:MAG: metalloregulator ArsR/SmtB family transcription factor [Phycisphaeraceae bacterium]|nr:metalloregulator ArsR/SmtB family transcription factor [Phycisphaeraceae bacterium]
MKAPATIPITERLADLSELVRLRLLRLLEREELSVGEVAKVVQLPQSTVSRHLKLLADGGWVVRRAVGTATFYRVIAEELAEAQRAIWRTVREHLGGGREWAEDDRRLASVLAERREDSVAFFGQLAGKWDDLRRSLFGSAFTAESLLALVPADWTVADLGCGTGNGSECIAPYVKRVIAVDQSEPMLKAARKRLSSFRNVEWRLGTLEDPPLADASVDAVMCLLVLHHVKDPAAALSRMHRVLRADRGGGVVVIVDMIEHDRAEYKHDLGHLHLGFSEAEITTLLKKAGFSHVRFRELPSDPEGKGPGLFVATGSTRTVD